MGFCQGGFVVRTRNMGGAGPGRLVARHYCGCWDTERSRSMPWKEASIMSQRLELVMLLQAVDGPGFTELCRRFGVSRKTAYKWLARYRGGDRQLADHSR